MREAELGIQDNEVKRMAVSTMKLHTMTMMVYMRTMMMKILLMLMLLLMLMMQVVLSESDTVGRTVVNGMAYSSVTAFASASVLHIDAHTTADDCV
jgi:hypothetical protein